MQQLVVADRQSLRIRRCMQTIPQSRPRAGNSTPNATQIVQATGQRKQRMSSPLQWLLNLFASVSLWNRNCLCSQLSRLATLQVSGAIQPRSFLGHFLLESIDLFVHLHCQSNVVETVNQAVLSEFLDLK